MIKRLYRRFGVLSLLLPATLLLAPLYLYPLGQIVSLSFGSHPVSFGHYLDLFSEPFILRALVRTLQMSATIALICVIVGYPVAYAMRVVSDKTQRTMALMIMLPLWTSILVRCFAWIVILGRNGIANGALLGSGLIDHPLNLVYNSVGVYIGMLHVMLPYVVFPLYNNLRRIDMRLVSAAESLGAGRISAFFWVVLPLSMPGVLSGALLVFMGSLGIFVIPAILGGLSDTTYVMVIENQVNELNNWGLAAAMSVVLLLLTGLLTVLYESSLSFDQSKGIVGRMMTRIFQKGPISVMIFRQRLLARIFPSKGTSSPQYARRPSSNHVFVKTTALIIIVALAIPLLIIFPMSFGGDPYLAFPPRTWSIRWFETVLTRDDWAKPIITSFQAGAIATITSVLIGVPASYAVVRGKFPGKGLVTAVLISPMIVPVLVLSISLYAVFVRFELIGSVTGLALAHAVVALPYVVVTVSAALRSTDESLESAALTLGAGRIRAFWKVTLPVLKPAIMSATFLAFITSFDDVVLALFLGGTNAKTLPLRMWEGIRYEINPAIAAASVLLICMTVGLKFITEWSRKRSEKTGTAAEAVVDAAHI